MLQKLLAWFMHFSYGCEPVFERTETGGMRAPKPPWRCKYCGTVYNHYYTFDY